MQRAFARALVCAGACLRMQQNMHQGARRASLGASRMGSWLGFGCWKALYQNGFPVPEPIDVSRHAVVMSLVDGYPLCAHPPGVPIPHFLSVACACVRACVYVCVRVQLGAGACARIMY